MNIIEIWKSIPGFEDQYEVSDHGRVRSVDRTIILGDGQKRTYRGKILKPGRAKSGHLTVVLGRAAGSRTVHSLVLLAFVGPPPSGQEGRHLNGVPGDNRLGNLTYGTRGDNMRDVKHHGGRSNYKLSPDDVREIRSLFDTWSGVQLATFFGVSDAVISAIRHGRIHTDVT